MKHRVSSQSRRGRALPGLLALGFGIQFPIHLPAIPYSLDGFVSGGGGISSGSTYALAASFGQPGTLVLFSGSYRIEGGFWPALVDPAPVAIPKLVIYFADGKVWISWSPATPGFILEQTGDPSMTEWMSAPPGNPVAVPLSEAPVFYRLRKF